METTLVYWDFIGLMEKNMETTILLCGIYAVIVGNKGICYFGITQGLYSHITYQDPVRHTTGPKSLFAGSSLL